MVGHIMHGKAKEEKLLSFCLLFLFLCVAS